MSVNRFQFIGNLTRDAEVQSTTGNRTRGIIDIAVTDTWRDTSTGQKQEKTNYFRLKCWEKLAENAGKYLGKGSKVYVEGRLENTEHEREGQKVYGIDFVLEQIEYLNTKPPAAAKDGGKE